MFHYLVEERSNYWRIIWSPNCSLKMGKQGSSIWVFLHYFFFFLLERFKFYSNELDIFSLNKIKFYIKLQKNSETSNFYHICRFPMILAWIILLYDFTEAPSTPAGESVAHIMVIVSSPTKMLETSKILLWVLPKVHLVKLCLLSTGHFQPQALIITSLRVSGVAQVSFICS